MSLSSPGMCGKDRPCTPTSVRAHRSGFSVDSLDGDWRGGGRRRYSGHIARSRSFFLALVTRPTTLPIVRVSCALGMAHAIRPASLSSRSRAPLSSSPRSRPAAFGAPLCAEGSFGATGEEPCTPCAPASFASASGQSSAPSFAGPGHLCGLAGSSIVHAMLSSERSRRFARDNRQITSDDVIGPSFKASPWASSMRSLPRYVPEPRMWTWPLRYGRLARSRTDRPSHVARDQRGGVRASAPERPCRYIRGRSNPDPF